MVGHANDDGQAGEAAPSLQWFTGPFVHHQGLGALSRFWFGSWLDVIRGCVIRGGKRCIKDRPVFSSLGWVESSYQIQNQNQPNHQTTSPKLKHLSTKDNQNASPDPPPPPPPYHHHDGSSPPR